MIDRRKRLGLLGGVVAAIAAAVVVVSQWPASPPPPPPPPSPITKDSQQVVLQSFPLPPYSESRYLNTNPDAKYIGTAACAKCHDANHKSYLHTAHSRAFSDIDVPAEPPDGSFEHQASGRSYRVYRQDGQLHHQEVVRTAEGKEIARVDLPVRYLVGSGHFSRTYLVEVDGFLHESPITWYASKNKWGVSPGYDFPVHASFERPVGTECLTCHVGRSERVGNAIHSLTFPEKAIGCENCHGPGSLHQEFHNTKKLAPGEDDWSIVHPGKLPRQLREDICANCHQSGPARVALRGRDITDFRLGTPLSDYRVNYRLEGGDDKMTVVGHVDQLHMSACYQKSKDMTCTTCHDPHEREVPKDRTEFFRQKCLTCHTKQPCHLEPAERLKRNPTDNCAACHMPRGDTDIPHIAFTHHRIGLHNGQRPSTSGPIPNLVPIGDNSRLTAIDQQRNLGLAYLEVARNAPQSPYMPTYRFRAQENLLAVQAAGLKDSATSAALAEIFWTDDPPRARSYALQGLDAKDAAPNVQASLLMIRAYGAVQVRDFQSAIGPLEELVKLRRNADDWRLLGMSYLRCNDPRKALPALQQALAIRPFRNTVHSGLAEVYRQLGDTPRADEHLEKSRWLSLHRQD